MESVEIKLAGAVKQAAIDIIDNLGKEAAECIILSQRKVELLQSQLNYDKEQALSMLMQVKRASDAQVLLRTVFIILCALVLLLMELLGM